MGGPQPIQNCSIASMEATARMQECKNARMQAAGLDKGLPAVQVPKTDSNTDLRRSSGSTLGGATGAPASAPVVMW